LLQARQQLLHDLFQEAKSRLGSLTNDKAHYEQLLQNLVLQSLYQLCDPQVTLQCKQSEKAMVAQAAEEAKKRYESSLNTKVNIVMNEQDFLSEKSAGGIALSVMQDRIRSVNTLEARLDLLSDSMLPDIRILLFGPSENRRFYN
jgi:V-type H+-transporting ATPase subunit E